MSLRAERSEWRSNLLFIRKDPAFVDRFGPRAALWVRVPAPSKRGRALVMRERRNCGFLAKLAESL